MATDVNELALPEVDLVDLDRRQALDVLDAARRQHWLARLAIGYVVTRHEDVGGILRDQRFHSAIALGPALQGVTDEELIGRLQRSILAMDGADHTRLRRLVSGAFTPRSTEKLRPFMRSVMADLVADAAVKGRCELVGDICEPYPIPIICELLGAPREDWKLFSGWATDIFRLFNQDLSNDTPRIKTATRELGDYVTAMIERRRQQPADDLLSRLIAAEEEGDRLSTAELVMLTQAVLMAGTDTTRNQLACSVALLVRHPDIWSQLARDPSSAAAVVEETMRLLGAVRGTVRVASVDVEYRDVLFPAGTVVVASLAAGNHDPEVWDDPHKMDPSRFDTGRPDKVGQLTFGHGIHYCLGANLARAELQEALPVLATAMPNVRLDGPIEWKPPATGIWGPARLPLAFDRSE